MSNITFPGLGLEFNISQIAFHIGSFRNTLVCHINSVRNNNLDASIQKTRW